jgi:thiol-disulfide isomerase/thioredoxin
MALQKRFQNASHAKTRKGGKFRKRYKTVRGHRHTTAGKIFPLLNVRSSNQLHHIKKYLNQGLVIVLVIVADWCGHCQNLKPHIEAAAKLPQRNVQLITVRDDMLSGYNKTVNSFNRSASPISVDGYPSVILVSPNGNKLSEISPTKEALNSAMVNVGPVAVEAGLTSVTSRKPNHMRNPVSPRNGSPDEIVEEVVENELDSPAESNLSGPGYESAPSIAPTSFEHVTISNYSNDKTISQGEPSYKGEEGEKNDVGVSPPIKSLTFSANANASRPSSRIVTETVPNNAIKKGNMPKEGEITRAEAEGITSLQAEPVSPGVHIDDIRKPQAVRGGTIIGGGSKGGSLYGIMSESAYRLAPTAVLLATAAAVMKRKTRGHKKAFKSMMKKQGTKKRRRYTK